MQRFDFEQADDWDPDQSPRLPLGRHLVTIISATSDLNKNENNQIELEVENELGTRRDWITYKEDNGVRRVATLFKRAGVPLKNEDADDTNKISDAKTAQLIGKRVGVIVREEPSYKEPGKQELKIVGYLAPDEVADGANGAPGASSGSTRARVRDREIPF